MKPEEVTRVAKKILPWLPKNNCEWRVALQTLINHYDAALAEVELERELRRYRRQLEQQAEPV